MELGWRHALAVIATLFVAFLLFKMRPARRPGRARAADLLLLLQAARGRARGAKTPEDRAAALCEAGALASGARRTTAAAGFFLRAMRADPSSPRVIEQAAAALARPAPRLLEKMLWRRLSLLPWEGAPRAAARAAAIALRDLYTTGAIRDRSRAELMRKLSRMLEGAAP